MSFIILLLSMLITDNSNVDPREIIKYIQFCNVKHNVSTHKYYTTVIVASEADCHYIIRATENPGVSDLRISYIKLNKLDRECLNNIGMYIGEKKKTDLRFNNISISSSDIRNYRDENLYNIKVKIKNRADVEFGINPKNDYWVGLCWPKARETFSTVYLNRQAPLKRFLDNVYKYVLKHSNQ